MSSSLSRRSFLRAAAGTLAYLPRVAGVPGAFLLASAPAAAWAEEAVVPGEEYDPAHVVVIDPDELGFQVMNVASGLALADAHVTVTSYAEGAAKQTLEGYTDSSGLWVSKVGDLCEPDGLARPVKSYQFYAKIEIQKDGYRPFTTTLLRAVAGQGIAVGTQPIEAGKPYPRMASFNEYDALYVANEFIRSTANDAFCTLELLMENFDGTGSVAAQLYKDETALDLRGSFTPNQGSVLVHLEGTLLKAGTTGSLAAGAGYNMHLNYRAGSNDVEMIVPLSLVIMDAPEGVAAPITDATQNAEKTFSIFNRTLVEDTGLTFPSSWPIIGGQRLNMWTPECACGFAIDPFGFIRISFKTPPLGMKDKYGKEEDAKWGWHPRQDESSQIASQKAYIERQREKESSFFENYDPFTGEGANPEALTQDQPTKKLGFTVMGEVAAILQWKTAGAIPFYTAENLEGIMQFHVLAALNYLYKQQFVLASIPMIFSFGVNVSVDVGIMSDLTSPSFQELMRGNIDVDLEKTGFELTVCIVVSISLGVGIDGLFTVSLRGILTITLFLGVTPPPAGKSNPHFVFALNFRVQIVIQFLCFTATFTPLPELQEICFGKDPLYDNWADKLSDYHEALEERQSMYEFLTNGARILDNDTLASRGECVIDSTNDMFTYVSQSMTGMLESTQQTFATDDGEPYTMFVYTPVAQERFEALRSSVLLAMEQTNDADLNELLAQVSSSNGSDLLPVFGCSGDDLDVRASFSDYSNKYVFERPRAGIAGLGMFEGVRPTSDIKITENVFSDPRTKVVSVFGRLCALRIATVELSTGDARTRLVLQEVPANGSAGELQLLDFKLTVGRYPRYEYFDYGFDVIESTTTDESDKERCELHLMVVSGIREDDDETTIVGAAQGHIFSYVRYSFTDPNDLSQRYAIAAQVTPDKVHATDCPDDWENHLYMSPQIKMVEHNGQKACVMAFVDRAGRDEAAVLNDQSTNDTRVGVGMFFAKVADGVSKDALPSLSVPDLSGLRDKLGSMNDLALSGMNLTGLVSGYNTIKFTSDQNSHYLLLGVNPAMSVGMGGQDEALGQGMPGIGRIMRVTDEAIADVITDPEEVQLELHDVLGKDYLLTSVNGRINKVTWGNTESSYPVPVLEECSPEGVRVQSFAVDPSGEFIYWPTIADGDAPTRYDKYGQRIPSEDQVKQYRIMACRLRNGQFSKPFVLAEGETHAFDELAVLENNYEGISFVSSEVVDAYQAQGNQWFTLVPHLRSITVAYLCAENAFVHPGDEVTFRIALRNDGNTYLSRATIRLQTSLDEDAEVFAEHTLVFGEDNILVSQWNPQGADGKPTGLESDYALMPGATSLYHIPGFTIPEDAPHDIYVYAKIVEGSVGLADMDGMTVQAEEQVQEFLGTGYKTIASGDRVLAGETMVTVASDTETTVDVSHLRPSNVTYQTSGSGGGNFGGGNFGGGNSGGGNSGGSTSGGSSSGGSAGRTSGNSGRSAVLPQTGDETGGLGVAGVVAGAAGAAMVAYSRRRELIERERAAEAEG